MDKLSNKELEKIHLRRKYFGWNDTGRQSFKRNLVLKKLYLS
jgi:hypothetical protein